MQRLSFPTRGTRMRAGRIGRITLATGIVGAAVFGTFAAANAQTTTTTPTATETQLTPAQLDAAKACMTARGFTVRTRGDKTTATTIAGSPTTTKAPKTEETAEQRAARAAAAVACGLPARGPDGDGERGGHRHGHGHDGNGGPDGDGERGGHGHGHGGPGGPGGSGGPGGPGHGGGVPLTDAQKACLTGKGITLPTPPAAGSNPTGTRPARIAPTEAERAAREAAEMACGIVRPARDTTGTATTPTTVKT